MTAVDYLIEQLQAPCRGIPSHIIEEAKKLERKHMIAFADRFAKDFIGYDRVYSGPETAAEQYYNQTYKQSG